jgi:hypothetical protein
VLHEQLLQQQLAAAEQATSTPVFNTLPPHIITTLDNVAFGIAKKEGVDSLVVKQRFVENVNNLTELDVQYLVEQLTILIEKSVHHNETIDDKTVEKDFVSFLIRLFY